MKIDEIIANLEQLNITSSELDIPEEQRNDLTQQVVDYANQFIVSLNSTKGYNEKPLGNLKIEDDKTPLSKLLEIYQSEVVETGINAASPKHLGYIPGGGVFTAVLADFLAAVTNPYASVYYASPGAAAVENEVVNWLKSVFSFPDSAVGCLSSGGSISTLIALTAARDKHQVKNEVIPQSVVYLSEQVHHSTQKALRIIGLEDVIVRHIPVDNNFRIIPQELQRLIESDKAKGLNPFLVVATVGTTDTGAVDPLDKIADIAQQHHL